jgi:transmembrane sensor
MNHDKDILLARYFGGNASKAEMQELEGWMAASPLHQQEFDEMTQLYMKLAGPLKEMPIPNRANAKAAFGAYINKSKHLDSQTTATKRIPFSKKWMAIAASIALIVSISIRIWIIPSGEYEVTLVAKSSPKHEFLPDKTEIKLSGNSKVVYSSNFGKKTKKLKLEGEAKFEVGHAGIGTLQVAAQETFIEDIGTVFTVNAYPDSNYVRVKVSKGQVHFFSKNDKGLIINANETGVYDKKTKTFKILKLKLEQLIAKGLHVEFKGMVLREVIDIINKGYHVDVKMAEKSMGQRKITVIFDGESLDMVLEIIAETLDLKLNHENNNYILSNKKEGDE